MGTRLIHRVTLVGFIIIVVSLFYYQIIKGEYFLKRARANYIRVVPQEAIRGTIMDRNSYIVARDLPVFDIAVVPYQIGKGKKIIINNIAQFLNISKDKILNNYKRNLKSLFSPVEILLDIPKEETLRLKEKFGDDILIKEAPQRYYPFSYELSHILGYVKQAACFYDELKVYGYTPYERLGFLGLEQYYDSYLRGKNGGKLIEVDSTGKVVGFLGISHPHRGRDITLTIDIRMQQIAYQALAGYKGVIILMDPTTGEIFVFCSQPSYSLNHFIKGINVEEILKGKDKPIINRGIQASYPLGSVFKTIVAIAGLEEEKINTKETFNCEEIFSLGGYKFGCWSRHGRQNLHEGIVHSCNVYFYNLGLRIGIDILSSWAKKFGLGQVSGIDLPYEKKGLVPDANWKLKNKKSSWFTGDTLNTSIGQGYLEATPLQVLVAISVFANGGYIIRPHLLKRVEDLESTFISKDFLNISASNLRIVREALKDAVIRSDGTAHLLESLKLGIAGKTGTAQTVGKPHAWFLGFFPFNNPRYSICVFLENAGSSFEALKVTHGFLEKLKEKKLID